MHKFIALSCTHAPLTHEGYWDWVLGIIEDFKPDTFVHLGDLYEGKFAKRFPKHAEETWTVTAEHNAVAKQLTQINSLVPGTKVWLWGNHDENSFGHLPDRIEEDIRDGIRPERYRPTAEALEPWKVIKYSHRHCFKLGPVTFQHGVAVNINAEKDQAYNYGSPFGLYVQGHTHRPIPVTQAEERQNPLPYWYANPGCGCDWTRMRYMDRCKMVKWGRGLIIGEVSDSSVNNRKATFSSKQWDAELLVHSWASDVKQTVESVSRKYGVAG